MQTPFRGLKFCGARARVAYVRLALAATRVMFHGYFESTSTKQYSGKFLLSKGFTSLRISVYDCYTL